MKRGRGRPPGPKGPAAYRMRLEGQAWIDVSQALNWKHDVTAIKAARRYAWRNGLEWPPRPRDRPTCSPKGGQAYQMRQEGRPWADIAVAFDWKNAMVATRAARRHAERNGLEWPPRHGQPAPEPALDPQRRSIDSVIGEM